MAKIRLAKNAGFCWGVKRAIDISLEAAREKTKAIYTFGPLIHNPQLIDLLKSKNIHTINSVDEVGKEEEIIIRTHGITPAKRADIKNGGHKIIDATCPLVAKVQGMIKKYSYKGYPIIIVGDDGHAEVVGLKGFAKTSVHLIADAGEVDSLPIYEKVFVCAQTTCDRTKYAEVQKALQQKYSTVEVGDTICEATYIRQDEIIELAKEVEAMVVVGGKNSANTTRLANIARERGVDAFHIETEDELDLEKLKNYKSIGLTAGASTPKWLIERVVQKLSTIGDEKNYPFPSIAEALRFFVKSNLFLAFNAAALTFANMKVMGISANLAAIVLSFCAVLSTYLFHQLFNASDLMVSNPAKYYYHYRYKKLFWTMALTSLLCGAFFATKLGLAQLGIYILLVALGATYRTNFFNWKNLLPLAKMASIPGSKDIFAAIAWGIITVAVPYISATGEGINFHIPLTFTLCAIYVRSVLFELRDMAADRMVGRDVLPVLFGIGNASTVLHVVTLGMSLFFITLFFFGSGSSYLIAMTIGFLYLFLFSYSHRESVWVNSTKFELFLDGQLLLFATLVAAL